MSESEINTNSRPEAQTAIEQSLALIDLETIQDRIYMVRNKQVMLDSDLAILYQVETRRLNQNVRRNPQRFPESFCFQLTEEEYSSLKSQIVTSNESSGRGSEA